MASVADEEGGHAPHVVAGGRRPRAPCGSVSRAAPSATVASTAAPSTPSASSTRARPRRVVELGAVHVAGVEQAAVHGQELVGVAGRGPTTPAWRASRPESSCGRSQMSVSPSATWTWPSENGHEGDVPVGAGLEAGDHVLVGDAGEGAAVVPGDGEGEGHGWSNTGRRRGIPGGRRRGTRRSAGRRRQKPRAAVPITSPVARPPTTSLAWWMRT